MREGDAIHAITPWRPFYERYAQPVSPARSWQNKPPWRFPGVPLYGQMLTSNLAEAISTPGKGHVRALINAGGNLASIVPDQRKVVEALRSLDLLVSMDPFLSTTAQLSHYIFGPKLQYERDDLPFAYST